DGNEKLQRVASTGDSMCSFYGPGAAPDRGERHIALPVAPRTVEKDPRTHFAAPVLCRDNGSVADRARQRRGRFGRCHSSPPHGPGAFSTAVGANSTGQSQVPSPSNSGFCVYRGALYGTSS